MPRTTPVAALEDAGRLRLTVATAFAPAAWGSTYLVTTELLPADHPAFAAVVRALPAGLLALAFVRRLPCGIWWWRSLVIGSLNIGIFFPLLFVSAERLPGGVAATFGAVQPLVVAALSIAVLQEAPSLWRFGWGLAGLVGVGLVALTPEAALDPLGVAAGIAGAVSMALGVTFAKRWGRPVGVSPVAFAGWQLTAGGIVLVPVSLAEGAPSTVDAGGATGYLWLGIFGGLAAYTLWFRGIGHLPVTSVAMLGLLSPVVAAALGAAVLGETFTPLQLAGFALALVAILGSQLPEPRRAPHLSMSHQPTHERSHTMKIMVIGGTGYIGGAVVRRLLEGGHTPVVAVPDPRNAPEGVESRVADLTDPAGLQAAITTDIDGVVHAATPTDDWDADLEAVAALTDSLAGRALVYLSGVWVLGSPGHPVDESAPPRPIEMVAGRPRLEEQVLRAENVRGVVIRPGIVHGAGGGIPAMLVDWARHAGTGRYVGDPTVRWPLVHIDDLTDLVVLALERAEPGTVLHGVAEPAVPVTALAAAADLAAGGSGRSESWPEPQAAAELGGPFAAALALDQEVLAGTAAALGWAPSRPDAVTDLASGSYRLPEHVG